MNRYKHLKEKCYIFRERGLSLGDISERLNLPKTTVYYWIRGTKIPRTKKQTKQLLRLHRCNQKNLKHFKELRDEAYNLAAKSAENDLNNKLYRDFICIYLTEGYRKTRHCVQVCNSNSNIIKCAYRWISKFANRERKISIYVRIHHDNDPREVVKFWSNELKVPESAIRISMKKDSGMLRKRNYALKNGICSVRVCDTYLRAKVQAGMDFLEREWKGMFQ